MAALVPAALAAAGASGVGDAAHDFGLVRTAGAGFAGHLRALDLLVAAPAMLLPFGTRALRAGLASAALTGIAGALAFDVTRALADAVPALLARLKIGPGAGDTSPASPRLLAAVSAATVMTALLSPPWQTEAAAPGGAVAGVVLVLLALRLGIASTLDAGVRLPAIALVLGLASGYAPLVFVAALAGASPAASSARGASRDLQLRALAAFALGLVPLALAFAVSRRNPEIAVPAPLVQLGLVEPSALPSTSLGTATLISHISDVGLPLAVASAGGALLSLATRALRPLVGALGGVALVGALAVGLKAAAGPAVYAPEVLAGLLAFHILAVTLLAGIVVLVARARVPFAEASAAFVVLIELVLPVRAADETTSRRDARIAWGADVWNDIAWGAAPPAAVLVIPDRSTYVRIASARAAGADRGDLVVVPAFDVQGGAGQRALVAEPKLAPLFRDVALGVPPEELSLATLGSERPVLATFDPGWDHALARHLVPLGLLNRFEPEPRGASDRRKALETFLPARDRLVRIAIGKKDATLAAATTTLLRARAIGMAATGEREILERSLDDLRLFSPTDPVDTKLVRRMLTTKGPIDVHDLAAP